MNELRRLRGVSSRYLTLPPYCFPCSLAYIQPSLMNCPDGVWKPTHNKQFIDKTDGVELKAEVKHNRTNINVNGMLFKNLFFLSIQVFSVLNGIVRVILYSGEENINKFLIENRIADHSEESYMSKV